MGEMSISELSGRSGIPATTLRYYEQVGLLPARRTASGYRVYDERSQERVGFISAAKRLRLPLAEIHDLLGAWEADPCRSVKAELRAALDGRIAQTSEGLAELTQLYNELRTARARLDALPDRDERCDPGCMFLTHPPAPEPELADSVRCSLGTRDRQARIERWHNTLRDAERERVHGAARFRVSRELAGELAALVVAEQECCPFLEFAIIFERDTVLLKVAAPAEGQVMIDELLSGVSAAM
jgi:MerR family copper efflux transcriptional regulator